MMLASPTGIKCQRFNPSHRGTVSNKICRPTSTCWTTRCFNPLLIGEQLPTMLEACEGTFGAVFQSPSHRGTASNLPETSMTVPAESSSEFQSPSHRGTASNALQDSTRFRKAMLRFQSPSHRGTASNRLSLPSTSALAVFQSPSHRGTASNVLSVYGCLD